MTRIGYTLMTEQSGPRDLVHYAQQAERAGFDFEVCSDHYFPWLHSQGHAPYAWSLLGAVSQVTERVELMTYVTCPTRRYHPAVVAQKAATLGILSDNRFLLGLGAGEQLNEHVVGSWPPVNVRHEMLSEALGLINALFDGGYVDFTGNHFRADSARLWDLPEHRVPIGVAVSGAQGVDLFASLADHMISTEPDADLVSRWDEAAGSRARRESGATGVRAQPRKIAQMPICWAPDEDEAVRLAHEQFRWFGLGWKVNSELPGPSAFESATQFVRPEDVAASIPCGPDLGRIAEGVRGYVDAGYTDVALVQIGDARQQDFLDMAGSDLLPTLHAELRPGEGPA